MDVERRIRAFQRQLAEWSAAGRPGVPVFALPGTPEPGTCISCGALRGKRLRCAPCISAVDAVLDAILVTTMYADYNRTYFESRLPPATIFILGPDHPPSAIAGKANGVVSGEYDRDSHSITLYIPEEANPRTLERALLHEMIHAAVLQDGHGAPFRAELQRVAELGSEEADYEVWRMVCDWVWEDGWIGEESGRWERYREDHRDEDGCVCSDCWRRNPTPAELAAAAETHS